MKTIAWHKYLLDQKELHGKVLFSVSELANIGNTTPAVLNLALARLAANGVITRYVRGWYGLPGQVIIDQLVSSLDTGAYITGAVALYRHGVITQMQTQTVCFTNRRYNRARKRRTPLGTLVFACVRQPVYAPPQDGGVWAPATQALFDHVYISRRDGVDPQSLVTLRNLHTFDPEEIAHVGERYPESVRDQIRGMLG